MKMRKMSAVFLAFAAVFLFSAQSALAFTEIAPTDAYNAVSAGNGVIIDVRTVEEHNGCNASWDGVFSGCPTAEAENRGAPAWVDSATGVTMQSANVPWWIRTVDSLVVPESATAFNAGIQALLDSGYITESSPVYFLCRSGGRSGGAAAWIDSGGGGGFNFTDVYNITGGMLEWTASGLDVSWISALNRGWKAPQIYSVTPVDSSTETTNTVSFTVGVLEPEWGDTGSTVYYATIESLSLYMDGSVVASTTSDPTSGAIWTTYTFTDVTVPNGAHIWNVRAESLGLYSTTTLLSWSSNADAEGPGDRALTVSGTDPNDIDDDGDGFTENEGDCDDTDPNIYPGADDSDCNGVDNDCNGVVDDAYVATETACGVGVCAATGLLECQSGILVDSCVASAPAADDATCDGLDDDCDGAVDEDYASVATTCGLGVCEATGQIECVAGAEVDTCVASAPAADDATCDGLDNDCDGVVDEDYASVATTCGVGICEAEGSTSCVVGAVEDSCVEGTPETEVYGDPTCADTLDNDCDGLTDLADPDCAEVCVPVAADDTTCDGIDDDCDGAVDEDYASATTTCGVGACEATGLFECVAGAEVDSCVAGTPAADDATCDGVDDDCDGAVDEDYASVTTTCGAGICASDGATSCVEGAVDDSCVEGTPETEGPFDDATCADQLDNDCDGATDLADSDCAEECVPVAADDITCDGIDDDCDGAVDEDYASATTTCGVGACEATGLFECVAGAEVDSCVAGTPAADDATCDGIDDDCDGAVDEDYASVTTTCGAGICEAEGSTSCVEGAVEDSCVEGTPEVEGPVGDATCSDGLDNDCDSAIDDADSDCVETEDERPIRRRRRHGRD